MEDDIQEIVKDSKKVGEFRAELQTLIESRGWKIILNALKADVREVQAKLNGELEYEKGETLEGLRDKRFDRISLSELPEYILEILEEKKGYPVNLDPYE